MVRYEFRCPTDGPFVRSAPMGQAPDAVDCETCRSPSPRAFSPPMTRSGSAAARSLLERTERSASAPDVVGSPPPRPVARGPRPARNPAWDRLPRP